MASNTLILFLLISGIVVCNWGCAVYHKTRILPDINRKFPASENSVTYIGHATVLIHLDNLNIITDPMFSDCLGGWFAKRNVEPGIKFEQLPTIDIILISHEHWDHLDKPTLKRISKNIPVVISKGLGKKIKKLGFNDVRELEWWGSTEINRAKITAIPVKHAISKPSGFIIEYNNKVVFFAGDTGLSDEFKEVGKKFLIDIAILPIGDYRPHVSFIPGASKWMRVFHMAPGDIPVAMEMLQPKMVIPIHWGTFKISGTGLNEPMEWLNKIIKEKKLEEEVFILNHGESKMF